MTAADTPGARTTRTDPPPGTSLASSVIPELVLVDAVELSGLIRRREVSCVAVMEAYLAHIDRFNPLVNAIVSRRDDAYLLDEARHRDHQLDRGEYAGWMHGFPVAVKDLADAAGLATTMGSPLFADNVAERDEPAVHRMRAAGAIVVGKTNVPEFGLGSHTFNPVFGTTVNPYDPVRSAGGSSGGAAAALAMRMLPVADGSDFMGSLRNPAAFCNVVGLRPSFGRVPAPGFLSDPSVLGPMGRTVRDTAMLLSTMAGPHPSAPLGIEQDPEVYAGDLQPYEDARIGWLGDFHGYLPTEAGVLDLCRRGLPAFEELGCTVEAVETRLPVEQAWETFLLWRSWKVGEKLHACYADPPARARLKPEAIFEVESYLRLGVRDIARATEGRTRWYDAVTELLDTYDFLLAPSAQVFPFDAGLRRPARVGEREMDTYHRWMETTAPWTLSGHPVLNLPVGFDEHGLPTGVQLIGRNHDELSLLRLGHAYEQVTDWSHRVLPPALR